MLPGGKFRHHPAEGRVIRYLAGYDIADRRFRAFEKSKRRVVAARFDPQSDEFPFPHGFLRQLEVKSQYDCRNLSQETAQDAGCRHQWQWPPCEPQEQPGEHPPEQLLLFLASPSRCIRTLHLQEGQRLAKASVSNLAPQSAHE